MAMSFDNEDCLQTVQSLIDDAQRAILQVALKGNVSANMRERISSMCKRAAAAADRLSIDNEETRNGK